jgi:hypothetical protein
MTVRRPYDYRTDAVVTYVADQPIYPTIGGLPQKYYFEIVATTLREGFFFGVAHAYAICPSSDAPNIYPAYGMLWLNGTASWYGVAGVITTSAVALVDGDVIGCEVDFSANQVRFYKNGTLIRTTTIETQFPTTGGANFVCGNSAACPLYLVAGVNAGVATPAAGGTLTVKLRPDWLYGPSAGDIAAYDIGGSADISTWTTNLPTSGSGASIVYQDPATGVDTQRSITGGEGIEVVQYVETVDVALKVAELTELTIANVSKTADYLPIYDTSALQHKKIKPASLFGTGNDGEALTLVGGVPAWAATAAGVVTVTPDSEVSSPSAEDDEFDTTAFSTSKWTRNTSFSSGAAPTVTETSGSVLVASAVSTLHVYTQPFAAPTTFKIRAHVRHFRQDSFLAAWQTDRICGLSITYSTTKHIMFGMFHKDSGYRFGVTRFNGAAAAASVYWLTAGDPYLNGALGWHFEIEVNATTIIYRVSMTGHPGTFFDVGSELISAFMGTTPDKFGFGVWNPSVGAGMTMLNYFRRVA